MSNANDFTIKSTSKSASQKAKKMQDQCGKIDITCEETEKDAIIQTVIEKIAEMYCSVASVDFEECSEKACQVTEEKYAGCQKHPTVLL